jgi:hypothetical protein
MKIRKLVSPFSLSLVTFLTSLALAGMTFAAPITYTFTGNGSGTVNGAPFTDAEYTITLIGDTTAITNSLNVYHLITTATMVIAGVGTATITDPVEIYDSPNVSALGFAREGGYTLLGLDNAAFATYALSTSLGPIVASGISVSQFTNLASTLGPITLSSTTGTTFQALLNPPTTTGTGNVSIPLKITIGSKDTTGDTRFRKLSSSFTGTMDMYFGENGPQPNAEGCYLKFSGGDGSTICIKQIVSISTDIEKSKTDQFLLIGTGAMTIVMEGTPLAGIAYVDSKGTLKKVGGEISAITLSGKIGGGGGEGTDQAFVLSGKVKATLTEQAD